MTLPELKKDRIQDPIKLHVFSASNRLQGALSYIELGNYSEGLRQAEEAIEECVAVAVLISTALGVKVNTGGKYIRKERT